MSLNLTSSQVARWFAAEPEHATKPRVLLGHDCPTSGLAGDPVPILLAMGSAVTWATAHTKAMALGS